MNEKQIAEGVRLILEGIGADVHDENFRETPERVARMYAAVFSPPPVRWKTFPAASSDLVLLRGHTAAAWCPHHMLPVALRCHVGYIPQEKTVGLSKLARVVDAHLTRPLLHEDLANGIATMLEVELEPRGVGVVIAGVHGCMRFRGVRTDGDVVVSVMRGTLLANSSARAEFMQIVGRP